MTRDNLKKRHIEKPVDCVFCAEEETISHLFHGCVVASEIWKFFSSHFGIPLGSDLLSVSRFWISQSKNSALNTICASVLWCIWKTRNAMILDNRPWSDIKQVLWMILKTFKNWSILSKESVLSKLDLSHLELTKKVAEPHPLTWG